MQVDRTKPKLRPPGTQHLNLNMMSCFQFCLHFAFKINLRRCTKAAEMRAGITALEAQVAQSKAGMDELRAEMEAAAAAAAEAGGFFRTSSPPTLDVLFLILRAFILEFTLKPSRAPIALLISTTLLFSITVQFSKTPQS